MNTFIKMAKISKLNLRRELI